MDRIAKLNAAQITAKDSESWHNDYKDSAYIYAGGLSPELTEGDVVCIFSQYGEILHIDLVRDKKTGNSKGFAFLRYADQRSTVLAVDNLNSAKVLDRKLRVDHVAEYKLHKGDGELDLDDPRAGMNVAPVAMLPAAPSASALERKQIEAAEEDYTHGIDPEDPMFEYLVNERREAALAKKDRRRRHRSRSRDVERKVRHRSSDRTGHNERRTDHRSHRSVRDKERPRSSSRRRHERERSRRGSRRSRTRSP